MVTPANPLLVVAAVRQELKPLADRCRNGDLQLLVTGMGQERAACEIKRWLSRNSCRGLVATGFAGATQPGLRVGDLIVADEVMEAHSGERFQPTLKAPASESIPIRKGRLVSLKQVAWSPGEKAHIGERFQALGIDLETAAAVRVAQEFGLPWLAVRAVLDPMEAWLVSPWIFRRMFVASRRLAAYLEVVSSSQEGGVPWILRG